MDIQQAVIDVANLSHRYGERVALEDLTLQVQRGEVFAFLGPNGGGKTTLFRILSTMAAVQQGRASVLRCELPRQARMVRRRIGVVFQAASLDRKLTVGENVRLHAALYGLSRAVAAGRQQQLLQQLGLSDRVSERVEKLSGGLRRRVELAKCMLHRPELLLLDEPSTGLDPGARKDLWDCLQQLRTEHGVTVVLTTHLLDEADRADRIAILNHGRLAALDSPQALKASVGGDSITIRCRDAARLRDDIAQRFQAAASVVDAQVRLEHIEGPHWIGRLLEAFGDRIEAITLGRPTLEDVFIRKTGHRFWNGTNDGV